MNIEYKTYDELISLVAEFRLQHKDLSDEDQDRLLLKTFKIDRATLRDISGTTDLINHLIK
jgi:hypothetical protein